MNTNILKGMLHSPISNYAIPGLTSFLVGGESHGKVRLFDCSRNHQEEIIPHSHRFDFQCLVVTGKVTNRIWTKNTNGDAFTVTSLVYDGAMGKYKSNELHVSLFGFCEMTHKAGEWYSMAAQEIHSIKFAKDTQVLFFEGPSIKDNSLILEPFVDGKTVKTFKVEPWMFESA